MGIILFTAQICLGKLLIYTLICIHMGSIGNIYICVKYIIIASVLCNSSYMYIMGPFIHESFVTNVVPAHHTPSYYIHSCGINSYHRSLRLYHVDCIEFSQRQGLIQDYYEGGGMLTFQCFACK